MIKIEFLYQKWCSYEFQLGNYTFKMKLSKHYSYLNDKGSVRKRSKISAKSIPRFIPACRYSTIRPFS